MSKDEKNNSTPNIQEGIKTLYEYIYSKSILTERIRREKNFWAQKYLNDDGRSAWLHNSILNKHADIVDNMPTCVCLPREERDVEAAELLSKIIPVINSRCRFEQIYSDNAWNKVRYGTAVYGVFWNSQGYDGLGDVDIRKINIENIFWEMGVEDIDDSKNLFICAMEDNETLFDKYPYLGKDILYDGLTRSIFGQLCVSDSKSVVVDWYYKKRRDGRDILHLCKFSEYGMIYSSELDESCVNGWYEHARYPVVFDAMYPCDGEVSGFGIISMGRGCDEYIERLDKNIENYANLASNVRFWAKKSLGINIEDFKNTSNSIIEVEGDIDDEKLKRVEVGDMDESVIDIKQMKIDELKEITGCRDVSVGRTSGNVSAASAISMLQNANAKFSRDGIENSCRACIKIWELTLELIRQFYTEERVFRIAGEGNYEYEYFKPERIRHDDGYSPSFDIQIDTRKRSYSERQELNNFALQLYEKGGFNKENLDATRLLLTLVDYDGVGKLKSAILRENTFDMSKVL